MTADHSPTPFSSAKADDFANRLLTILNQSSLCLMISIGHRTGLFDTMSNLEPSSSAEIASKAGLNERYVREWLGAMVTGGVVDLDPNTNKFSLPLEHAAALTRAAGSNNMAVFAQYIGMMGSVEDDIVECFYKGGGVPYSRFPRFHAVMAEDSGQSVLSSLESHILPLVPGLSDKLAKGIQMLDVGCGRGLIMNRLAELFPKSRFTGMDLSSEAVMFAWKTAAEKKLRNVEFIVADLSHFDRNRRSRSVRSGNHVRCGSRSKGSVKRTQRHSPRSPSRWRLPYAGHQRLKPRSQESRSSDRHFLIYRVMHALHDGFVGAGR